MDSGKSADVSGGLIYLDQACIYVELADDLGPDPLYDPTGKLQFSPFLQASSPYGASSVGNPTTAAVRIRRQPQVTTTARSNRHTPPPPPLINPVVIVRPERGNWVENHDANPGGCKKSLPCPSVAAGEGGRCQFSSSFDNKRVGNIQQPTRCRTPENPKPQDPVGQFPLVDRTSSIIIV